MVKPMKYLTNRWARIAASVIVYGAAPVIAFAQLKPSAPIKTVSGLQDKILCQGLNWLFTFSIAMGVVFLILAAFRYVSSGGSSEEVKKVHQAVTYAIVGIAVAILAGGAPYIIGSFVNDGGQGGSFDYCKVQNARDTGSISI